MPVYFEDDFNRADNTDIGAGWVDNVGSYAAGMSIVNNTLKPPTPEYSAVRTATPTDTDAIIVTVDFLQASNGEELLIALGMTDTVWDGVDESPNLDRQPGAGSGYCLHKWAWDGEFALLRNGVTTPVATSTGHSTATVTFPVVFSHDGSGQVNASIDGGTSNIIEYTDGTPLTSGRYVGLYERHSSGTGSAFDNFSAGDLPATLLDSGAAGFADQGTTITTASVAPGANCTLVLLVTGLNFNNGTFDCFPGSVASSASGPAWGTSDYSQALTNFIAGGAAFSTQIGGVDPGSFAVTWTSESDAMGSYNYSLWRVVGHNSHFTSTVGGGAQTSTAATAVTLTMDGTPPPNSVTVALTGADRDAGNGAVAEFGTTSGTWYATGAEASSWSGATGYRVGYTADADVDWSDVKANAAYSSAQVALTVAREPVLFADDFNRADSTDLGADWVNDLGRFGSGCEVLSNGLRGSTNTSNPGYACHATPFGAAQFVEVTETNTGNNAIVGINHDINNSATGPQVYLTGYAIRHFQYSGGILEILRNGVSVSSDSVGAAPGVLRLEHDGVGGVTKYFDGVEIDSYTDGSPLATYRYVGIGGAISTFDNFSAGDFLGRKFVEDAMQYAQGSDLVSAADWDASVDSGIGVPRSDQHYEHHGLQVIDMSASNTGVVCVYQKHMGSADQHAQITSFLDFDDDTLTDHLVILRGQSSDATYSTYSGYLVGIAASDGVTDITSVVRGQIYRMDAGTRTLLDDVEIPPARYNNDWGAATVEGSIVGDIITLYVNGVEWLTYDISADGTVYDAGEWVGFYAARRTEGTTSQPWVTNWMAWIDGWTGEL